MKMSIKILAIMVFLLKSHVVESQDLNIFNGYKYIYLPPLEYGNGKIDVYGISAEASRIFSEEGFKVLTNNTRTESLPKDLKDDLCQMLTCSISHPKPNTISNSVTISFYDCNKKLVYSTKGSGGMGMDLSGDYRIATKKALKEFKENYYSFNSSLTPELILPQVEKTQETEESLKKYFSENQLNPIEGIYKSVQNEGVSYYKIAIKKLNDKYIGIVLEADLKQWKTGEIKAYFEPSSVDGIYSVKWFMANKTHIETFATMENLAILSVEIENNQTGQKTPSQFIKMFPQSINNNTPNAENQKSSGSGFFITSDGVIATNAHVVENAKSIQINVSNGTSSNDYIAKVLLVDKNNDVALLKIEDPKFKSLSTIPYVLRNKADIGEKVFTIGYPLNDVMGSNYKVTDGILSSASGIADDIRYFQISVPIQPGNSGGPLFNNNGDIIGITTAKLNSEAVGKEVENVNYAIKISYLINLYDMLPNSKNLTSINTITKKELHEQVKVLKDFVCLIKVN
jgi:S1-C subfamily serine protease